MANGAPTVSNGLVISGVTTTSDIRVGTGITLTTAGNGNFVGVVTATTFVGNLTGNLTGNVSGTTGVFNDFINVGSNIQLGNAGIVTATGFVDDGTNLLTEINTKATTGKAIAMAMVFG
tara:strand:- start:276 stop:632 length:357 start_codon:yes stop_codon:yes gene_type:complete